MAAFETPVAATNAPVPAGLVEKATEEQKTSLLTNHDCFIFDCDGTLWKGPKLLDGVPELLKLLRSQNKRLFFVTNNATKSRRELLTKCEEKGLNVSIEEMYSSAYAAVAYLKALRFKKKVYVIGEAGLVEELKALGVEVLGGPAHNGRVVDWAAAEPDVSVDLDVGAVVVGLDRGINYYKLQYATKALLGNPGCLFIATNTDSRAHLTAHQEWADSGPMVAAIVGSTELEPVVVGKPSPIMIDTIRRVSGVPKPKMCIIGDRLDTDMVWGLQNGCTTVLVLTGVTDEAHLQDPSNTIKPALVIDAVGDLLSVKDKMPYKCMMQ